MSQPICQTSVRHTCTRHVMGSHTTLIMAQPERADCLLVQRHARRPPTSLQDAVSSTGPSRIKAECWPTAHPPPLCGRLYKQTIRPLKPCRNQNRVRSHNVPSACVSDRCLAYRLRQRMRSASFFCRVYQVYRSTQNVSLFPSLGVLGHPTTLLSCCYTLVHPPGGRYNHDEWTEPVPIGLPPACRICDLPFCGMSRTGVRWCHESSPGYACRYRDSGSGWTLVIPPT